MRSRGAAALLAVLLLGMVGCGTDDEGEDDVEDADAAAQLEQQRTDVRAATSDLQKGAADALGGSVTSSTGQWRGCESGGLEEFKSFRYLAGARIDVTGSTAHPYLDLLGDAFERAGFSAPEAGERPGGRTLRATSGDVSASFSELPEQGDYVLLSVAGPCIDVPEDDRDDWLTKKEPTPDIR